MGPKLGFVPLILNAIALLLSWVAMGTDWTKVCYTFPTDICIEKKLFEGSSDSDVQAVEAMVVITMICLLVGLVGGLIYMITSLLRTVTLLLAAGGNIAAAVCSLIAIVVYASELIPQGGEVDVGLVLFGICIIIGVINCVLWAITRTREEETAPAT